MHRNSRHGMIPGGAAGDPPARPASGHAGRPAFRPAPAGRMSRYEKPLLGARPVFRAACAAALIGSAAALALSALRVVPAAPGQLIATYWPLVLIAAGAGGIRHGLGAAMYGRWIPIGLMVIGGALLSAHLTHMPLGTLTAAALLAWAGLSVAFGGSKGRGTTPKQ